MKGSKNIIRLVIDKFHILVVQNISIELYKKSVLHVQSCFFAKDQLSKGQEIREREWGMANREQRIFKTRNL